MGNDHDNAADEFSHFEQKFIERHGDLMSSNDLVAALGFPSLGALRQARRRKSFDLKMFKIDGRAGVFALSVDVAKYLWNLRNESEASKVWPVK